MASLQVRPDFHDRGTKAVLEAEYPGARTIYEMYYYGAFPDTIFARKRLTRAARDLRESLLESLLEDALARVANEVRSKKKRK